MDDDALHHFSKKFPNIHKKLEEFKEHEKNELWPLPPDGKFGVFTMKRGADWLRDAAQKPIPRMLFDEFWYQDEVCILFADTNTGKSILAVQIADSIARGVPIPGFRLEAEAQEVVYCDFELSEKQFERRYSTDFQEHYTFNDNFFRAEINVDHELDERHRTFEEYLQDTIEDALNYARAKVLIIDNITYLKHDNERAKDALPLMKQLKRIKKKYDASILVLAHTPKRDLSKPMTRNDLQGSKMLISICDSSFCIGESTQAQGLRYLKQIKMRASEGIYHTDNVVLCQIEKPHNFLQFCFMNYATEREHLKEREEKDRAFLIERAKELKAEGKSYRDIGKELGISKSTAENYVKD